MSRSALQEICVRMGMRLARRHVAEATSPFGLPPSPAEQRAEVESSFWRRRSVDFSFENGYSAVWSQLGAADVRDGRCKARTYQTHGYNLGWRGEYTRLNAKGWRHSLLQREAETMEVLYWDRIATGDSAAYYAGSDT